VATNEAELRTEVGAQATPANDAKLTKCLAIATELVNKWIADNVPDAEIVPDHDEVPEVMFDQAVLTAAADIWHQSKAPNGVVNQQFQPGIGTADLAATPIRISRDPLRGVRPLLSLWIGPPVA
jgi:hypothetical protein